nr:nitronate monooxygenase [Micromonospora sp. DSM 115978]
VVTTKVDGMPHRVLRTALVDRITDAGRVRSLTAAARNASRFRRETGASWRALLGEGRALRSAGLSWPQIVMAANAPMLLKASMVDGRTDLGLMTSGQVVGLVDDVPTVEELVERMVRDAVAAAVRISRMVPA